MKLDLSSFVNAVSSLDEVLLEYKSNPNVFVRDAGIQRFEYTYELSWKMLKRHLEVTAANPSEVDGMSFPNLIRTGSEKGLLLNGWDVWSKYRKARSTTSHVYDMIKAEEVFSIIPNFKQDAEFLLKKLQDNNV